MGQSSDILIQSFTYFLADSSSLYFIIFLSKEAISPFRLVAKTLYKHSRLKLQTSQQPKNEVSDYTVFWPHFYYRCHMSNIAHSK